MRHLALLIAPCLFSAAIASAQTVYVDSDHTVANGNPLNGNTGTLFVGQTAAGSFVSGVDADVVAPARVVGYLYGVSDSRTTVTGGSFLSPANGGGFSGVYLSQTAQLRVAGSVTLGIAALSDGASLTLDAGWLEGIQLRGNASATVNAGRVDAFSSITALDAWGAGSLLTLNGGLSTGAVRAFGGTVRLNGGGYATLHALSNFEVNSLRPNGAHLVALNRSNGRGHFSLTGSNFVLSNATAGTYSDGYINSLPGVSFRLTGTMPDGQAIDALYFEEGLQLGQAPGSIDFLPSAVPEASTWAQLLLGLALLAALGARAGRARGQSQVGAFGGHAFFSGHGVEKERPVRRRAKCCFCACVPFPGRA